MGKPWPIAALIVVYLYLVLVFGPRWMKNQTPFDLTRVINAYNVFQMLINLYIFSMVSSDAMKSI